MLSGCRNEGLHISLYCVSLCAKSIKTSGCQSGLVRRMTCSASLLSGWREEPVAVETAGAEMTARSVFSSLNCSTSDVCRQYQGHTTTLQSGGVTLSEIRNKSAKCSLSTMRTKKSRSVHVLYWTVLQFADWHCLHSWKLIFASYYIVNG